MYGEPKTDADNRLDMFIENLIKNKGDLLARFADEECERKHIGRLQQGALKEHLGVILTSPNFIRDKARWEMLLANENTAQAALKEIVSLVVSDVESTRAGTQ